MILIKKKEEMEELVQSGKILSAVLRELTKMAKEGISLHALNERAVDLCREYKARPAFLGYQPEGAEHPYPAALCTSLNEVVVHGIPSHKILRNGDVLKIDMGISYNGFITDAARTVCIGKTSSVARKLVQETRVALEKGITAAKRGNHIGDIGYAIERVAKANRMFVLKGLTGHGVGYELHEDPVIYNFGKKGTGPEIKDGMVLAIEPMFSIGTEEIIQNNDESYSSADGSLTAHFEHTIAILGRKTIVLTE